MARTPVSSTVSMGARDSGLIGCRQRRQLGAGQRAQPVQRTAGAVQHAPEQGIAHGQVAAQLGLGVAVQLGLAGQRNLALHGRLAGHHAGAGRQAGNIGLRHQVQGVAVEAHDLGVGPVVMPARDLDAGGGAHRQAQAGGVQHQARGAGDAAADHQGSVEAARIEPISSWVCQRSITGTAGRALMASPLSPGPVLPRKCCGPARPPRDASASAAWRRCRHRAFRRGSRARAIRRPARASGLPSVRRPGAGG